jgi:hypothetical protein
MRMAIGRSVSVAICYDFDGTLAPGNMQEHSFIPALGVGSGEFWARAQRMAEEQDADPILAYMKLMLDMARAAGLPVRRDDFRAHGARLECFPGVDSWFKRVNAYAASRGVAVEHFIVSSGLREMIEGTRIAGEFARIYASGFMYGADGIAAWPALAVNYTTKTQFLFRINKGTREVFDDSVINKYLPRDERPVPFSRIAYIGDGETDIPCFRLVKSEGGLAIAVYSEGAKERVESFAEGGRASLIAPADYRELSPIDLGVRSFIDRASSA